MSGWWLLALASYALGTFPTAQIVGRLAGHDPTTEGSRNPGATNVYRIAGRFPGATVLLGDVLKGLIPALVGLLVEDRALAVVCGGAAVVGHMFPIQRGLRGGKGVSTLGGMTWVLWPLVAAGGLVAWVAIVKITGRSSLGSIIGVPLLTLGVVLVGADGWEIAFMGGAAAVIVARHHSNIRRLFKGEEAAVTAPSAGTAA
ncbi:MAG: glycerol-3-phosphate acyltransferase [Acidimicrobiales bacterium]